MNDIDDDLPGMLALQNRVEAGEWPHTMDAQVWARKWLEITKEVPEVATDEDAMIGWFANAIMAGYDTAMLRNAKVSRIAELESQPADQFTGQLVEIDGHTYGLRPGAARVVKEAMRDAKAMVLDDETRWILGRPNFVCGPIAASLRLGGMSIATKAEDEQAAVIHWMLKLRAKHGDGWREVGENELREARIKRDAAMAKDGA